jgi:hypothetical protein
MAVATADLKGADWIKSLEDEGFALEAPRRSEGMAALVDTPRAVASGDKGVYGDASGLVTFVDNLSGDLQQDMLDVWEFSNRYADKKIHDKYGLTDAKEQGIDTKFTNSVEWYTNLGVALNNLHFTAQDFQFSSWGASGDTFTVDKMIIDVMQGMLGDDKSALEGAMAVLADAGKDDGAMKIWDSHSKSKSSGAMQKVFVRQKDANSPLSLVTGAFGLKTTTTITDVLFFFHFSTSDTQAVKATQDMVFNQKAYEPNREKVQEMLGKTTGDWLNKIGSL